MPLWMVRAGRRGEQENRAIEENIVTIGKNEFPDLSSFKSRDELKELYSKIRPEHSTHQAATQIGQAWTFSNKIKEGDVVVLPLKTQSTIAIGKIVGPYEYRTNMGNEIHHVRKVQWIKTDIPRTEFDQNLLYTLGSACTVCQVQRNNAEEKVKAIIEGRKLPPIIDDNGEEIDIEQVSRDHILEYIKQKFKGHDLARLVDAVLQCQGYTTKVSPPGPDGGVDILAGTGAMGFGSPRLCVQVKSSSSPSDVTVFRNLVGTLQSFSAEQGLLVCWGGFKSSVLAEARRSFFSVRLWDSGELLEAILKNYDKFSDSLQAELPLKRIWSLVQEEE